MSNNSNNLYDEFAKLVQLHSSDSAASTIANQYAIMTYSEESKPDTFMYNESNTWKLLAKLANKSHPEVHRYATVRQWVSQVPNDKALIEKIKEKNLMDEEIEEELNFIVRKNRILRPHQDERPSKIRRTTKDVGEETICEEKYAKLRKGELGEVIDSKPLAYLCNEYVKYGRYALEEKHREKINYKERLTWRDCVKHLANDESLGRYQRALYSALAGNANYLYKAECQTWEDVIWVYFNERVENMLDIEGQSTDGLCAMLDDKIEALALEKDNIMDSSDPRILFHHIQSAILSNTTPQLLLRLHDGFVLDKWSPDLHISKEYRDQALRFVSTWILFERQYSGLKDSQITTALLATYTELNAEPTSFRPVVIASYAAQLSPNDQATIFSKFLENFDGDREECIIINRLGKEYNLDMPKILEVTNSNILTKALQTTKPSLSTEFLIERGSDDCNYGLFFRALHWLLIDDNLALPAVQSANAIIRYFFAHRRIYLVKQVFDMVPESIYTRLVHEYKQGRYQANAIDEFDLHRKVMLIFTEYNRWEKLITSKPTDSGSSADYIKYTDWRDESEKLTSDMEDNIKAVLEGGWLKEESTRENISTVMSIRHIYIPEILIRYHNLLRLSTILDEKNKGRCNTLTHYVTIKHRDLFDDITSSKRWEDVLQEFCKSLPL